MDRGGAWNPSEKEEGETGDSSFAHSVRSVVLECQWWWWWW